MLAQVLSRPSKTVWNPLAKQYVEPDTTFLLDPDGDTAAGIPIGQNGSIGFGGLLYAVDSAAPNIIAGKYRKGIQPSASTNSWVWQPVDELLPPAEWTIEQWVAADADWTTLTSQQWILGYNANHNYVLFQINGSRVTVQIVHSQNAANLASYTATAQPAGTFSSGTYQANVFHSIAATFKSGTLTLYLDAVQIAQTTGIVPPTLVGQNSTQDGLKLATGVSNGSASHLTISDLRISRKARVPNVAMTKPTDLNSIVVANTTTGATVQKLNGSAKAPTGGTKAPLAAAAATSKAQAGLGTVRTDKFLEVTPILAGGTPDATHPTVGQSGLFCYDWQVVDREMDWIVNKFGAEPILTIGGVPQILGGSVAPYSNTDFTLSASAQAPDTLGTITFTSATTAVTIPGEFTAVVAGGGTNRYAFTNRGTNSLTGVTLISGTAGASIAAGATVHVGKLTGGFAYNSSAAPGPSNNNSSFASIAADLVHHVRTGLGYTSAVYWDLWNEPDQPGEWTGVTQFADYSALYQAVVTAVKAVAPSVKFGGPGVSSAELTTPRTTWIQGLINFCATNSLPLDYVHFHWYEAGFPLLLNIKLQIAAWATAAGIATPEVFIGEWNWQDSNIGFDPGTGKYPFFQPTSASNGSNTPPTLGSQGRIDFAANDYNAAFHAVGMIAMGTPGGAQITRAAAYTGNDTSFFDASSVPQPRYNVMRMWGMAVGNSVLNLTSTDLDAGMHVQASKDISGKVYVLIANLHYRELKPSYPVTVDVSAFGLADGTNVTAYAVDDTHSNAYDTLGATSTLQTITVPALSAGKVSLRVRPRSVTRLIIG